MRSFRYRTRHLAALLLGALFAFGGPASAQDDKKEKSTKRVESLNPAVARDLISAYEKLQAEQYKTALSELNSLLERRGDSMKPFDRASVLEIRGVTYVNLEQDKSAIRDFEEVLKIGALPDERNAQLRFNVAQLYFRAENYPLAIRYLEQWLKEAPAPDANAYYLLAAAYFYQRDYETAGKHSVRALQLATTPVRRHYDLTNIIYSELSRDKPRSRLLEEMIKLWTEDKNYWKQLAALYSQLGQARDAFAVLESAYNSGLVGEETDVITLAQYYSLFEAPYRGAVLLEKELKAGVVKRTVKNLELLSQLLSQAREHAKAAVVLKEAAQLSDKGALSYRLGQVLLADEKYAEAEKALEAALRKGGLKDREEADAWLLLGSARFNQAGPGERDKRREADEAFTEAVRFTQTRPQAAQWREYIQAINDTETRQARLEAQQREALARAARERLRTTCRAQQLTGAELSAECVELFREEQEQKQKAKQSAS